MARQFLTPPQLPSGSSLPSSGAAGNLFFKSDESKIYVHDGTNWVVAQGSGGGGGVVVSDTAPADPTEGTYWFDSTTAKSYIYYDSFWIEVGYSGGGYIVSETAPSNPSQGDVWFSTSEGVIYVYYDSYWVDPSTGGAAGVPVGGTTGQVLSKVDATDYNTAWVDPVASVSSLTDVQLTSVQDGETLIYDSASGTWINGTGGSSTTVSTTAPTDPAEGDTWFNSETGQTFIYYDSFWIETGTGPQGPSGIVSVTSPVTNSGTTTEAVLGLDQTALSITASQVSDVTASAAALNTIDDGTSGYTALSNGTAGISYQPVSHNYIINGAFDIWQRGTASTTIGFSAADRWVDLSDGAGTYSVTQQPFTPADLTAVGFGEGQYYLRHSTTSAATYQILETRLEDVRTLAGQTVTLSYWARVASGTVTNRPVLVQFFGSGGSASVETAQATHTITTSWQRFTHVFTLASVAGKTINAGNMLRARVLRVVPGVVADIDIWGVQLEAGSVATPFKRHAPSLQGELAACQRYYQRWVCSSYREYIQGISGSTNAAFVFRPFVSFRATPTAVDYNDTYLYDGYSYPTLTSYSLYASGTTSVTIIANGSGFTTARPITMYAGTSGNSYLGISAEL